jgi:hypothetical protein
MIVRTVAARGSRAATRAAFTLMEIMVVVAVTHYMESARVDATRAKLHTIEIAVTEYYQKNHEYPANLGILTQRSNETGTASLEPDQIRDEWGQEIMIDPNTRSATGRPLIYSNGAPGTNQPIKNFTEQ